MIENLGIRLQSIKIKNFKSLEELVIDFNEPKMIDEPDVCLMGSKNGIGKTSVLESIALLFVGIISDKERLNNLPFYKKAINIPDTIIRAGCNETIIEGTFFYNKEIIKASVLLNRDGLIISKGDTSVIKKLILKNSRKKIFEENIVLDFCLVLAGISREPFTCFPLSYFHSYRKTQEGSTEFRMMFSEEYNHKNYDRNPVSSFKIEVLRSMMNKNKLFENSNEKEAENILEKLNSLIKKYAYGYIDKLKPSDDNTIDFRIKPLDKNKKSFSFDGLSSGQKEIISTLFLIWFYTHNKSGIILIDEPELHLNVEWHKNFIQNLYKIAPNNQYIISTHSEEIFSSVKKEHRILLVPDKE
ncbi:MAG: AAA family ATPase [Cyanobacteriota bacterium]